MYHPRNWLRKKRHVPVQLRSWLTVLVFMNRRMLCTTGEGMYSFIRVLN